MTVAEAYVTIPVPDLAVLGFTAASIGVVHTLLGPDHYLPFVALARTRRWSTARTAAVTAACGDARSFELLDTLKDAPGA